MRQVYGFRIDRSDNVYNALKNICKISKNLYNQALYEVKRHYAQTGKILFYEQLDEIMKNKTNLDGNINYRLIPAQVAQQTLKLVAQNVKAFFKALKDYKKQPEKYTGSPNFPGYLPKDGYFAAIFPNQKATITEESIMKLTKEIVIAIPVHEFAKYKDYFLTKDEQGETNPLFHQVRIVPKFQGEFFHVEIVYDKPEINADVDIHRVASLDLGVNNLITLVDSHMGVENRPPVIVNGKPLKSINQYYNKQRAEIQHNLKKQDQTTSHQLHHISDWRNEKIKDYMHKASRFIIRYLLENHIGHITIGYNPNWKQNVNLGKTNNQNFVFIPFLLLIQLILYKAALVGIKVTVSSEEYTSKCSALDLEEIAKHEDHAYAGKRLKRGLFQTATGICINADVNGALNILRKAIGDSFLKAFRNVARLTPSSGYLLYPLKLCC